MANKVVRNQIKNTIPTFTPVTFTNGWANYDSGTEYGPVGYYKDAMGIVHLRGLAAGGTIGQNMFTLPAGFRPSAGILIFTTISTANTSAARVHIRTDGTVAALGGGNGWIVLSGLSFIAGK